MVEKTIELTDDQLEKVKYLEDKGLSVGDAVDMLFKIKDDIEAHREEIAEGIEIFVKLNNQSIDFEEKHEDSPKEEKQTYDEKIQAVKRNISWTHDFFKF